jgi:hypothetical protein
VTLSDFVAQHGLCWSGFDIATAISTARMIVADNVGDYFWQSPQEEWPIATSFPSLVPPFKEQFIEWSIPKSVAFGGGTKAFPFPSGMMARQGVLITAYEQTSDADHRFARELLDEFSQNAKGPAFDDAPRWIITCHAICAIRDKAAAWPWVTMIAVNPTGDVCGHWMTRTDLDARGKALQPHPFVPPTMSYTDTRLEEILPALLTVSLMNCSNVTQREVRPPKALDRATFKRRGIRLRSYHVLEIEPFKAASKREAGSAASISARQALNICRGHFKDYRKSGLFGKIKGVFWWDQYSRGDTEAGRVIKDYSVTP